MVRRVGVAYFPCEGRFAVWLHPEESSAWALVLANSGLLFHMERVEACLAFLGGSEPCGACSTCCRSVDL